MHHCATEVMLRFLGWHKHTLGNLDAGPDFAQMEETAHGHGDSFF